MNALFEIALSPGVVVFTAWTSIGAHQNTSLKNFKHCFHTAPNCGHTFQPKTIAMQRAVYRTVRETATFIAGIDAIFKT